VCVCVCENANKANLRIGYLSATGGYFIWQRCVHIVELIFDPLKFKVQNRCEIRKPVAQQVQLEFLHLCAISVFYGSE